LRTQISNLKFEIRIENAKERKVRTPKGSEPANGGASDRIQISDFKIEISDYERVGRRQVQQRTDQPTALSDSEISFPKRGVMGETVRPARANFRFEISNLKE